MSVPFSSYFRLKKTELVQTKTIEGYECCYPHSTLILYSKVSQTPLAALVFSADSPGLITARPSLPNSPAMCFQGVLNQTQHFRFTIVNLTQEGYINFNILHTPHRVNSTDPGPAFGINQINELRPNECIVVDTDQRTGRQMILAPILSNNNDPVTVQESEVPASTNKGLYFYLSVVPSNKHQATLEAFGEGSVWKSATHFIRLKVKPNLHLQQNPISMFSNVNSPVDTELERQARVQRRARRRANRFIYERENVDADESEMYLGYPSRGLDNFGTLEFKSGNIRNVKKSLQKILASNNVQQTSADFQQASNNVQQAPVDFHQTSTDFQQAPADFQQAWAGKLQYGEAKEVISSVTYEEYDYEKTSEQTILCLSIYPSLELLPLGDIHEELENTWRHYLSDSAQKVIQNLPQVFRSETCCIDLESPADTIVCNCGHQCIHHTNVRNIKRCPMCRGMVSALVRADGFFVSA